jgi:hypothetical protein
MPSRRIKRDSSGRKSKKNVWGSSGFRSALRRRARLQQADRRPTYRSPPYNKDSVALEVLIPLALPWMKQLDERAAFRVKSARVRSLVCIAVVAGDSEVSAIVSSAMLASDDVLNVIRAGATDVGCMRRQRSLRRKLVRSRSFHQNRQLDCSQTNQNNIETTRLSHPLMSPNSLRPPFDHGTDVGFVGCIASFSCHKALCYSIKTG